MSKLEKDRRIRKTKSLIRNSLIQLLKEKKLKDITVRELTEMADINRGTFYLHYQDLHDLFEQTENEIMDDLIEIRNKYYKEQSHMLPVLLDISTFIKANSEILEALLRSNESRFLNQMIELCRPQDKMEWYNLFASGKEEHFEYYYSFISSGFIALFLRWLEEGMQESPEHIAGLANQLITNCTKNLS